MTWHVFLLDKKLCLPNWKSNASRFSRKKSISHTFTTLVSSSSSAMMVVQLHKLITYLLLIKLLVHQSQANCRAIPEDLLSFGDFFVPNPTKFIQSTGVITSSNFPENYNTNEQCGFVIEAPEGSRIKLEFTDYDVDEEAVLGVFDGNLSPFGGLYSPFPTNTSNVPPVFISNTNIVAINFSTGEDTSQAASGWRLLFSVISRSKQPDSQPILVIDSATSTFIMAVISVVIIFISGIIP